MNNSNSVRKTTKNTISRYYQGKYSPGKAKFFTTPHFRQYISRKVEAEEHDCVWREFLKYLLTAFPHIEIVDKTTLGEESCYRASITPGQSHSSEQCDWRELIILVSVLEPLFHYWFADDGGNQDLPGSDLPVEPFKSSVSSISDVQNALTAAVETFWRNNGYIFLSEAEAGRVVNSVYSRYSWRKGRVLDLLFLE